MNQRTTWRHLFSPARPAEVLRRHALAVLPAAIILFSAATAGAQVERAVIHSYRPDDLPGYWTHDILIDFTGQYTGSQMIVELTSGQIYQNRTPFVGNTPPLPVILSIDPAAAWDTFVANGGPTAADTIGDFALGSAAISIDPDFMGRGAERPAVFSDAVIDQSWSPADGNVISDLEGFMVARITLSDYAHGTLRFVASANQVIGLQEVVVVAPRHQITFSGEQHGVTLPIFGGCLICVPEPSSILLFGLGLVALLAVKRHRPGRASETAAEEQPLCARGCGLDCRETCA